MHLCWADLDELSSHSCLSFPSKAEQELPLKGRRVLQRCLIHSLALSPSPSCSSRLTPWGVLITPSSHSFCSATPCIASVPTPVNHKSDPSSGCPRPRRPPSPSSLGPWLSEASSISVFPSPHSVQGKSRHPKDGHLGLRPGLATHWPCELR